MLIISGLFLFRPPRFCLNSFNLAIEMLIISGSAFTFSRAVRPIVVSISQSRCLSFQGSPPRFGSRTSWFQSRNRDAYHFRFQERYLNSMLSGLFQSRNRDAYHFRAERCAEQHADTSPVSISQSRCLSFQGIVVSAQGTVSGFQSRNRDAYHFRNLTNAYYAIHQTSFNLAIEMLIISGSAVRILNPNLIRCFNLAIEMLIISGTADAHAEMDVSSGFNLAIEMLIISGLRGMLSLIGDFEVSISQSRCLSFQVVRVLTEEASMSYVSISQSRCLSFQDAYPADGEETVILFQSRNRDAYHFR